jgi:Flp pilus assembly protein TadG
MLSMKGSDRKEQSGQVAVLFALAAIAMVAIVGLAIDGGTSYVDQRALQAGSDSSATAGATMLAADFHSCASSGSLPYTASDITTVVTGIAKKAVTASGHATGAGGVGMQFVNWAPGATPPLTTDSAPSSTWCSGNTWQGPFGVTVATANSHHTILLQIVGVSQAHEAATATVAFGLPLSGTYAPFVACNVQPLIVASTGAKGTSGTTLSVGDTVLLASPKWGSTESTCNGHSKDFHGYLHDPSPNPVTLPTNGTTTPISTTKGGTTCGGWPTSPIDFRDGLAVGKTVLVPLTSGLSGDGIYTIGVQGMVAVQITVDACPNVQGVVTTIGSATGVPTCSSTVTCGSLLSNPSELAVIQIVN